MLIAERCENGITVLVLSGRIDREGALEMERALRSAASQGRHRVVLDMAAVPYMGSTGLRALVEALNRNRSAGGDLKLAALEPRVMRVLRIIGFNRLLPTCDTLEAALAEFRVQGSPGHPVPCTGGGPPGGGPPLGCPSNG